MPPCGKEFSMTVELTHYLAVSALLFGIAVAGLFLNKKNIITVLMCIELMLLSVSINFIAFSHFLNDLTGQIFSLFVLTVAAAESAIGLAIFVMYFRAHHTIDIQTASQMKG